MPRAAKPLKNTIIKHQILIYFNTHMCHGALRGKSHYKLSKFILFVKNSI